MRILFGLLTCGLLLTPSLALALDTVRTVDGRSISGTIDSINRTELEITAVGNNKQKLEINQVDSIRWDREPPQLNLVRSAIQQGNFDQAIKGLENDALKPDKLDRVEVKQQVAYFNALAKARAALISGDVAQLREAGSALNKFVTENASSWHYFEAKEVIGDLFQALGDVDNAIASYKEVEQAPWDSHKMRGAVARGRALQAGQKYADAQKAYDEAIARGQGKTDAGVDSQLLAATVGKAACMAETGDADGGAKLIQGVIEKANPEDRELHAVAFVTLGNCYSKANRPKDALLEYLKVHVLYNSYPAYHAEALYNLTNLWKVVGKPDYAQETSQLLTERYPGSPWAKK